MRLSTYLKKKNKRKLATDYINACASHRIKKKKKKKTRAGVHKCCASHRIN
jgi:hypothetical protein